ncbi:hypothetical protein DSL72_005260 [Monilinia vaccinii-corymbosi]|uniref:NAD(P)-binding protein n=1 Tax=Monilinia vaccinii-corymbosi TaxID=61207 RepID=A0A8A3PF47_9HELO|nr:hypothetical protein DSL72_005260 [Monilinia vaccinii-corymbosi]
MSFPSSPKHYLVIGASRGIGLEFTRQLLLASPTNIVIATHRSTETPPTLQELDGRFHSPPRLWTVKCDLGDESTIESLCLAVSELLARGGAGEKCIETVIVSAGVLEWPGGVLGGTSQSYHSHFQTNTIGPLLTAKHLLAIPRFRISTVAFISSDSGSATNFRSFEDGFAAYAASKAALNMGLRHLAAELHRKNDPAAPIVLALHPGEVNTDMAKDVDLPWEVKGVIEVEESVRGCLKVIGEKGKGGVDDGGRATSWASGKLEEDGAATFWTWDGRRYPW